MSDLLKIALNELGTKEISGGDHNARILQYAEEAGIEGMSTDEIPWCSNFMNWCCHKLELEKSGKPNARSWLKVGSKAQDPIPGDIVVFWRGSRQSWQGHVGIFMGYSRDHSKVFTLGGNQGDSVSIQAYDAGKVLDFRRVQKVDLVSMPRPTLKNGSKGGEVVKLQILLNEIGYNCGDADGAFGPKTENSLKNFQADEQLAVDGVYGPNTRDAMESRRQS